MGMLASMWGSRFRIEFESQPLQKASQKSSPAKLCSQLRGFNRALEPAFLQRLVRGFGFVKLDAWELFEWIL